MNDETPELPASLNRKLWTPERLARAEAAAKALRETFRREAERAQKASRRAAAKARAEKEAKERAKAERKALHEARATKRKLRDTALANALSLALEKGEITVISLRKALPEAQKPFAGWAVRTAFKRKQLFRKADTTKVYIP
jgi:hypothetical protein